jgi:hypothetical protein
MRWRLLWYVVVVFGFVASFFFGVSMPKDMSSAMKIIAPIEEWWQIHAAHPSLSALFVGLAVGTVLLPELWIQLKPHIFPPRLVADISAGDAFKMLFADSKLASHLIKRKLLTRPVRYESHLTSQQIIDERLRVELADRVHNPLADGRLRAWGRLDGGRPESEIAFNEWSGIELDFSPRTLEASPSWVCAHKRENDPRGTRISYVGVRFSKTQLFREFPLRRLRRRKTHETKDAPGF